MTWVARHAASLEAVSAVMTAIIALVALVGVKYQLDAAEALQRAQSARDAYRSHLALAVAHPQFSRPDNVCELLDSDEAAAYEAFVDHLLYSAEQMLNVEAGWNDTFLAALQDHAVYICSSADELADEESVDMLLKAFKSTQCGSITACPL
ncbi:MAG: hypothetical protein AAF404_01940 [Pseudomonadota bacterium]